MPLDRNANTDFRQRRNAQRFRAEAANTFTAPLLLSGSVVSLTLAAAGGLQVTSNALSLLLNGSTLSLAAGGVSISNGGVGLVQLGALTTKGDLLTHTGVAHVRQGVGTNGQLLVADSGVTNGVKWVGPADNSLTFAAAGPSVKLDANGSIEINGANGIRVKLNGTTLNSSATGLKVADGGIGPTQMGIVTTKGDLLGYSTQADRVPVGVAGTVLIPKSSVALGLAWSDVFPLQQASTLAVIIGATNGNTRGNEAIDIQSRHTTATQVASGPDSLAVGVDNTASSDFTIGIGVDNTASDISAIAIGNSNTATGENSIAIGLSNHATAIVSMAIGFTNSAGGSASVAIGQTNDSAGVDAVAVGKDNNANGDKAVALGSGCFATDTNSVAVGFNITNSTADVAAFGTQDTGKILVSTEGLILPNIGQGVKIAEGANAKMGTATLVAGTVTVNTTQVTANSRIMLTGQNSSGTHGELTISARTGGTSFTITSNSATDTRAVAWIIFEPA